MCLLSRRLHILLDDRRYRRLQAEARARRASVGALVREAIDRTFPVPLERKRAAAKAMLAAKPMPLPADMCDLKAELDEIRAGAKKRSSSTRPCSRSPWAPSTTCASLRGR